MKVGIATAIFFPIVTGLCCKGQEGPAHAFEIFESESEVGERLFVGNGLVILEPFTGRFDSTHLFRAGRCVVDGSIGEAASEGIADRLKQ